MFKFNRVNAVFFSLNDRESDSVYLLNRGSQTLRLRLIITTKQNTVLPVPVAWCLFLMGHKMAFKSLLVFKFFPKNGL